MGFGYSYMNNIPWDLIRDFLAVAEHGSLSRAARQRAVSQPTLSRNIQAIETLTKLNLFQRSTQGLSLTEAGISLVAAAQQMEQGATRFTRLASGLSETLQGEIRISANDLVGTLLLPPALAAFRRKHPRLQIELVIDNHTTNISRRDADIALRMYRPTQPDLIARRLPDLAVGFFAHHDFIQRNGQPKDLVELFAMDVIGFDTLSDMLDGARAAGLSLSHEDFPLRTDHMLAQLNLARAGAGIVGTQCGLARQYPELEAVLPELDLPGLEFWLVSHSDAHFNTGIRSLIDFLAAWFEQDPYHHVAV